MLVDPIYLSPFLWEKTRSSKCYALTEDAAGKKRRCDETLINKNWRNEYIESNEQRETTKTQVYKVIGR